MIITITRTIILYIFVTLGIRLMGKRQIGEMQPNELVVTLLISETAAIPLQDTTQPILNGLVAIFVLVILEIMISVLSMKSRFMRKIMNGKSAVIIKNGVIDQQMMKSVRMTVLDLVELLRGQDVFDISTVAFAVLEVNGNLSVLLKSAEQPATVADLKIEKKKALLQLPVISDGKIVKESLDFVGADEKDIRKKLKGGNVADVFLMTMDREGNHNIIKREGKEMKRLIPAAILLAVVLISYFGSLKYINDSCAEADRLADKCEAEYRSGRNAEEEIERLKKLWDKKEKMLSFFVNHADIDNIELELSSLTVFASEKEDAMFYDHIESMRTMLHQIKEDTVLSTHSVF